MTFPPPGGDTGGEKTYGGAPGAYPPYGAAYGEPYPGQPYPGQPYPGQPYPRTSAASDLGLWSLILGIAAFVLGLGLITGIPAVVVGHMARTKAVAVPEGNAWMATVGIVLGWVSVAASILGVLVLLAFLGLFVAPLWG